MIRSVVAVGGLVTWVVLFAACLGAPEEEGVIEDEEALEVETEDSTARSQAGEVCTLLKACEDGLTCCNVGKFSSKIPHGVCRDLENDPLHCGSCNLKASRCAAGGDCIEGTCGAGVGASCGTLLHPTCHPTLTCCPPVPGGPPLSRCSDLEENINCGACGVVCAGPPPLNPGEEPGAPVQETCREAVGPIPAHCGPA